MHPDEFRRHGHVLVDWIADYFGQVGDLPITPAVQPGDIRAGLPGSAPEEGEPFEALFRDFRELILPGMTHWNHPGWFAYFPGNNSPPSMLGEMLTAAMGAQCMSWATSPAATELEQVVMDWLRQMLRLPDGFTGVIQDTASTATLVALLSARERATGGAAGTRGLANGGPPLAVYASREAHSSVDKGVQLAGIGLERLRHIPGDGAYAMDAGALAPRSRPTSPPAGAGLRGRLDRHDVVHRDGPGARDRRDLPRAMASGSTWTRRTPERPRSCPELRHLFAGWSGPTASCSTRTSGCWPTSTAPPTSSATSRRCSAPSGSHRSTCGPPQDAEVVNFRDWGHPARPAVSRAQAVVRDPELRRGRPARDGPPARGARGGAGGLDAGRAGLRADGAGALRPGVLPVAAGRPTGGASSTGSTRPLLARVNASRRVHLTHTRLGGRYVIRLVVGQRETAREDVRRRLAAGAERRQRSWLPR